MNQRSAYTNPISGTQIFYALRYYPPPQHCGQYTVLHEEKLDGRENDYLEDYDNQSHASAVLLCLATASVQRGSGNSIELPSNVSHAPKWDRLAALLIGYSEGTKNGGSTEGLLLWP